MVKSYQTLVAMVSRATGTLYTRSHDRCPPLPVVQLEPP